MSIFDIFRGGANPNAIQKNAAPHDPMNPQNPHLMNQNQQNQQQNQQPPQNQQVTDPNANPQNNNQNQNQQQTPPDPFKDLWTIDKNNPGPADLADFKFNFDPAKVDQQVQAMDFTKVITPEIAQKIAGGGPDAVTAMLTAMNLVGQQATKTALLAATKITETGLQSSGQRMKDAIPGIVREHTVSNALREDNPLFTDPATAPVFQAIESEFARKFPNATPQEIRENAKQYMARFATNAAKFAGKEIVEAGSQTQNDPTKRFLQTDWSQEPV